MATDEPTPDQYTPEAVKQILMDAITAALPSTPTPAAGPHAVISIDGRTDLDDTGEGADDHSLTTRNQLPRTPILKSSITAYQPETPSPLRHVVNGYGHSSDIDSPASIPRVPTTPDLRYQVPGEFLNAMIGLLERQANIVPEHLYTKADLDEAREAVRKEMQQKEAVIVKKQVTQEPDTWSETAVALLGSATAILVGAGVGILRRACLAHPDLTWYYVDGAWKGAACGLVGVLLYKGMLDTFDGRRGFYI